MNAKPGLRTIWYRALMGVVGDIQVFAANLERGRVEHGDTDAIVAGLLHARKRLDAVTKEIATIEKADIDLLNECFGLTAKQRLADVIRKMITAGGKAEVIKLTLSEDELRMLGFERESFQRTELKEENGQ